MNVRSFLIRGKNFLRRAYSGPPAPKAAPVPAPAAPGTPAPPSLKFKEERLRKVASILRCSQCAGKLNVEKSLCLDCGQNYHHTSSCFNFLTYDQQAEHKIVDTDNVASNDYDEVASAIIAQCRDGLILDCGAGSHRKDYPNVINYEVVGYESTDVLGVSERLPFQDASFDGIFSLNVLEHVANPFRSAHEITRVLKPGGTLYCVAPFLVPVHSYPNHFFNMSSQGLRHLFESNFEIIEHKVPASGLPVWAVNWILRSWSEGLAGKTKEDFLNMTVRDLTALEPLGYLERSFVKELSADKNFELATTTMLVGKKH